MNREQAAAVLALLVALADQMQTWSATICREHPVTDFEGWEETIRAAEEDVRALVSCMEG